MPAGALSAIRPASIRSSGRQPSSAARGGDLPLDIVQPFGLAARLDAPAGVVARFLHVGEPVMRHELDPECRDHVEERRLLVGAVAVAAGRTVSIVAVRHAGLVAREQLAADHLRISEQRDASAVAVAGELVEREIRIGRLELHVAEKQHAGRAHRGIVDVVADAVTLRKRISGPLQRWSPPERICRSRKLGWLRSSRISFHTFSTEPSICSPRPCGR